MGELSNIRRGASPRPISDPKWFSNESDIGWIRISDVTEQNGRIKNVEQKLSNLGMEKTLILDEGELILSIAASVGKPVINYIKTGIHDGFIVFLNPQFHRDFMFAWLERNQFIWNRYGQPGSQVNINSEIVKKQKVLLPNIKEQEKISNMILKFEDMITLHKRKIEVLKNQKEYFLRKIFANKSPFPLLRFKGYLTEWEKLKIKNIGKVVTGNTPPTSDLENYSDKGLTWITPGNINDDNQLINNYKKLSNKGLKKARIVPSGSVLVTCIASIGKNLLTTDSISFNQQINAIVPQKIHSEFIFYRMYEVSNYMKRIAPAATMQIISKSEFENIKSYFPKNQNEAVKVSAFVKEVDKMISLHKKKLNELESLKKEYLNYLFI